MTEYTVRYYSPPDLATVLWEGHYIDHDGYAHVSYPNGDQYEGAFLNSKKHGKGKYTWNTQTNNNEDDDEEEVQGNNAPLSPPLHPLSYEGDYVDGQREGQGTFLHPDGSKFVGKFAGNLRSGAGKYYYANGDFYEGGWSKGLKHGKGIYYWGYHGGDNKNKEFAPHLEAEFAFGSPLSGRVSLSPTLSFVSSFKSHDTPGGSLSVEVDGENGWKLKKWREGGVFMGGEWHSYGDRDVLSGIHANALKQKKQQDNENNEAVPPPVSQPPVFQAALRELQMNRLLQVNPTDLPSTSDEIIKNITSSYHIDWNGTLSAANKADKAKPQGDEDGETKEEEEQGDEEEPDLLKDSSHLYKSPCAYPSLDFLRGLITPIASSPSFTRLVVVDSSFEPRLYTEGIVLIPWVKRMRADGSGAGDYKIEGRNVWTSLTSSAMISTLEQQWEGHLQGVLAKTGNTLSYSSEPTSLPGVKPRVVYVSNPGDNGLLTSHRAVQQLNEEMMDLKGEYEGEDEDNDDGNNTSHHRVKLERINIIDSDYHTPDGIDALLSLLCKYGFLPTSPQFARESYQDQPPTSFLLFLSSATADLVAAVLKVSSLVRVTGAQKEEIKARKRAEEEEKNRKKKEEREAAKKAKAEEAERKKKEKQEKEEAKKAKSKGKAVKIVLDEEAKKKKDAEEEEEEDDEEEEENEEEDDKEDGDDNDAKKDDNNEDEEEEDEEVPVSVKKGKSKGAEDDDGDDDEDTSSGSDGEDEDVKANNPLNPFNKVQVPSEILASSYPGVIQQLFGVVGSFNGGVPRASFIHGIISGLSGGGNRHHSLLYALVLISVYVFQQKHTMMTQKYERKVDSKKQKAKAKEAEQGDEEEEEEDKGDKTNGNRPYGITFKQWLEQNPQLLGALHRN